MSIKNDIKKQPIEDIFIFENRVKGEIAYLNFTLAGANGKIYAARVFSIGNCDRYPLVILGLKSHEEAVEAFGELGAFVHAHGGTFTTDEAHPGIPKHLAKKCIVSLKRSPEEGVVKEQLLTILANLKITDVAPIVHLEDDETFEGSKDTVRFKAHVNTFNHEHLEEYFPVHPILHEMSYNKNQYSTFSKNLNKLMVDYEALDAECSKLSEKNATAVETLKVETPAVVTKPSSTGSILESREVIKSLKLKSENELSEERETLSPEFKKNILLLSKQIHLQSLRLQKYDPSDCDQQEPSAEIKKINEHLAKFDCIKPKEVEVKEVVDEVKGPKRPITLKKTESEVSDQTKKMIKQEKSVDSDSNGGDMEPEGDFLQ